MPAPEKSSSMTSVHVFPSAECQEPGCGDVVDEAVGRDHEAVWASAASSHGELLVVWFDSWQSKAKPALAIGRKPHQGSLPLGVAGKDDSSRACSK
jgi:hypothetical protein